MELEITTNIKFTTYILNFTLSLSGKVKDCTVSTLCHILSLIVLSNYCMIYQQLLLKINRG